MDHPLVVGHHYSVWWHLFPTSSLVKFDHGNLVSIKFETYYEKYNNFYKLGVENQYDGMVQQIKTSQPVLYHIPIGDGPRVMIPWCISPYYLLPSIGLQPAFHISMCLLS